MTHIGPRYAIMRKLGEGTFGEVFCAQHQDTGELVALKKIRIRAPENGIPKSIFREIKSMQLIDHENVLRCLDVYASGAHLVLVLDLMHSDLYQLLRNCASPLPEAVIKSIAQMMLCGLAGAHSENIIHRVCVGIFTLYSNFFD
jgi:serine/threonine protein kinase